MSDALVSATNNPLACLLQSAAFAPVAQQGWLRVTGEDRTRWLNGMTTNNIAALAPGHGCYTFFLSAQGRIQADSYAWAQPESIWLETADPTTLAAMLDRFIIMDDVELEVISRTGLSLTGPQAARVLTSLELTSPDLTSPEVPVPALLTFQDATFQTTPVTVFSTAAESFELWSDPATIGLLIETLRATGIAEATPEALTQLRILNGTPLYGTDIREKELPQETAPAGQQSRALHFTKGCYLGQEIVERIHSRGNVHRVFTGFQLTGQQPTAGTILTDPGDDSKPLGELTSTAQVGQQLLALGYIRREALERNLTLTYAGGTAKPASLPFPRNVS